METMKYGTERPVAQAVPILPILSILSMAGGAKGKLQR
jgi:hypothetical protein